MGNGEPSAPHFGYSGPDANDTFIAAAQQPSLKAVKRAIDDRDALVFGDGLEINLPGMLDPVLPREPEGGSFRLDLIYRHQDRFLSPSPAVRLGLPEAMPYPPGATPRTSWPAFARLRDLGTLRAP